MRKLGELITQHVPEIARTETQDTGQVITQTGKQLRLLNEVPGIAAAIIVIMVVLRPF